MREARIVSDTGPLISLEKLTDGYSFIRCLYSKIWIPASVLEELAAGVRLTPEQYLQHHQLEDLLECHPVDSPLLLPNHEMLAPAETEATTLASQQKLPLLIEERLGRRVATGMGLQVSGVAGQILKARRNSLIPSAEALGLLEQLKQHGRIPKALHQELRKAISEMG